MPDLTAPDRRSPRPRSRWPRVRRPRAARPRSRHGRGLGSRTALVTTAVALLAVIITGAIFLGQLGRVGETQARRTLGRQADLVADLARRPGALTGPARDGQLRADVARAVGAQQISLLVLDPNGVATLAVGPGENRRVPVLASGTRARLAGSDQNTAVRTVAGRRVLVASRPLSAGNTLVLVEDVSAARALTAAESRRLLVALVVALAVATVAGLVLARWLARPLRALAGAAHDLAGGRRDVDVALALPAGGPVEIADVAAALAGLAAALATSEARQREFLLSVSHELRTPLTAIRGFAEALADGVTPGDEAPHAGRVILGEALRLDRLVQDLLDLARLDADDFQVDLAPVDLGRVLTDAADVWRRRCGDEGIALRVEAPPPGRPVVVLGDAARLRQIVDGLAENALRVVPAGAPIVLAARAEPSQQGPWGVLEVRDGGPGLTADDCAVAFDRSALYERYRGLRPVSTGLGLALVGRLATRLGGQARAGVAAEGGAAFSVWLPLAPRDGDGTSTAHLTAGRPLALGPSTGARS